MYIYIRTCKQSWYNLPFDRQSKQSSKSTHHWVWMAWMVLSIGKNYSNMALPKTMAPRNLWFSFIFPPCNLMPGMDSAILSLFIDSYSGARCWNAGRLCQQKTMPTTQIDAVSNLSRKIWWKGTGGSFLAMQQRSSLQSKSRSLRSKCLCLDMGSLTYALDSNGAWQNFNHSWEQRPGYSYYLRRSEQMLVAASRVLFSSASACCSRLWHAAWPCVLVNLVREEVCLCASLAEGCAEVSI